MTDEEVEAVWSRFDKPVLILYSGEEEYAPKGVDTAALVDRWLSFCPPGVGSKLSGLIPGANHAVDAPDAQEWLCDRVIAFLNEC